MKSFANLLLEETMIITLLIMFQFFLLIILFGAGVLKMADEAKTTLLATYGSAFTASWGYWLGKKLNGGTKPPEEKS